MSGDDIRSVWKQAFGGDKPKQLSTPFDGQEFIDPGEFNDWLKKPCAKCGLPTVQQYQQMSHRGNFRHGGHKIVVRPVGQICKCAETCEVCGYTKADADFHLDHHLCRNSGNAPWERGARSLKEKQS